MSTKTRVSRHLYVDNPALPGTCLTCHLPDPKSRNTRHQLVASSEDATRREARMLGERSDE